MLEVKKIKADFPIFQQIPQLVYLDSTATALKPQVMIDALVDYYQNYSANVFRGIYRLSEQATKKYEESRNKLADFLNARSRREIVFVRSTTEALNLIAYSLGRQIVDKNSEIVVSIAEHHSNFVPWQQLVKENGAVFKVVEPDENGTVPFSDINEVEKVINKRTKLICLFYVSNVLGTINPLQKIIKNIKKINPKTIVVVDAAQAAPSLRINVQELGCDFLAFSAHKVMGPTGVGVLWGREELLETMFPFQFGGEMIETVGLETSTFKSSPHKYEAGTPHIAGVIALSAAVSYLMKFKEKDILAHERGLWRLAYEGLKNNKNVKIIGPKSAENRVGILAFVHNKIHAHDLSQVLANDNICVRAGHHCAMPLHTSLGIAASVRASFYLYNTKQDIEAFLQGIDRAERLFL